MGSVIRRKVDKTSLVSKVFGRLTVLSRDMTSTKAEKPWSCQCECGKVVQVRKCHLVLGLTKSCGCLVLADLTDDGPFKILFSRYKSHAKINNRAFSLTSKEFKELVSSNCHYCGLEPQQETIRKSKFGNSVFVYNGLDRVDPSLGYTIANAIPCCGQCNRAKSDMSYLEFKLWIKRVVDNWKI